MIRQQISNELKIETLIVLLLPLLYLSCASKGVSSKSDYSLQELIAADKNIFFENVVFEDEIDFISMKDKHLISNGIDQVTINSSITFKNCTFKKKVSGYSIESNTATFTVFKDNLTFLGCTFQDELSFRGVTVTGITDFSGSVFKKKVTFEEANFFRNTYFKTCNFEKETRFQNSFFLKNVFFNNSEFKENISFQDVSFNEESQFSVCKFYKYSDFSRVNFKGNAIFNYSDFYGRTTFGNSLFLKNFEYMYTKNNLTNFEGCRFMGIVKLFDSKSVNPVTFDKTFFLLEKPDLHFNKGKN